MGTHKLSRYTTSLSSRAAMDRLTSKQVSQSQVTACSPAGGGHRTCTWFTILLLALYTYSRAAGTPVKILKRKYTRIPRAS